MDRQPRRSKRLYQKYTNPDADRRKSVGAVLGLTPRKPKGANLGEARALDAAEAAAKRLDANNKNVNYQDRDVLKKCRSTLRHYTYTR